MVQRICQYCGQEFTAKTTVTQYCSHPCASKAYKARARASKVEVSNNETLLIKNQPIRVIQEKEFLTVREVSSLMGCSLRTVYYYIESGNLNAVNLGQRVTRVKRSDLDNIFLQNTSK